MRIEARENGNEYFLEVWYQDGEDSLAEIAKNRYGTNGLNIFVQDRETRPN